MQVDGTTFGIIPDTFDTLLSNYLTPLVTTGTFPNATSPNDPIYPMMFVAASQDQINQAAMMTLWNAINANTAQGTGLDILSSTVLNLTRRPLTPSSCVIQLTLAPIYSTCQIQMTVTTVSGSSAAITNGWIASGAATTSSAYTYLGANIPVSAPGTFYFTVQSTDTSTPIPASNFSGGSPLAGLTFTVTNPATATLGSLTIPTTWTVTASSLGAETPSYSLNSPETFTNSGSYNLIVYSQDITTPINPTQLNSPSATYDQIIAGVTYPTITNVTNQNAALLGTPIETDAQFAARRRYYLNVQGQTYYGLEKAIIDLQTPALQSVFIAETISNSTQSLSILVVEATIASGSGSVVIPNGWTVFVSGTSPSPNYATIQEYTVGASVSGTTTTYIPTFSTDISTPVGVSAVVSATSPFGTSITAVTNTVPAILNQTETLGQRGYTVYLEYPTVPLSSVLMRVDVSAVGGSPPYFIPIGWEVSGSTVSPTYPYLATSSTKVTTTGSYFITCYSRDSTTPIPVSTLTGATSVSGLTFSSVSNVFPATLGGPNAGGFDVNDLYLQQIAQTCYAYHPLGTNFYSGGIGATQFTVNTPYAGYTYNVLLNPFQTSQASVNLQLVYNSVPQDAGFSNGVFNTSLLPTLQTTILEIINNYFLSKTLPTDLVYSINELSIILQNSFTGIVALVGNGGNAFSFGIISESSSNLLYIRRTIGYIFNLDIANFNFTATPKESYTP